MRDRDGDLGQRQGQGSLLGIARRVLFEWLVCMSGAAQEELLAGAGATVGITDTVAASGYAVSCSMAGMHARGSIGG